MRLIGKFIISALFTHFMAGQYLHGAEFEVLDRLSVDGYTVLRGSADIPGGSFAVGGSVFVVNSGNVGIGTTGPNTRLEVSGPLSSDVINALTLSNDSSAAGTNRSVNLLFRDNYGGTLTSSITGRRNNPVGNWYGNLYFNVSTLNSPATDPAALTSMLMIEGQSRRVGIGTTAPGTTLHVSVSQDNTTLRKEILRIERIGGAAASGGAGRTAELAFFDSDNPSYTASIGGLREDPGSSYYSALVFYTTPVNGSVGYSPALANLTEKMRITSAGNVGIGTTSPVQPLDVNGQVLARRGIEATMGVLGTDPGSVGFDNAGGMRLWTDALPYTFYTDRSFSTARLTITASGNVGIGTTAPVQKLLIKETSAAYTDIGIESNARKYVIGVGNSAETSYGVPNKFYIFDNNAAAMRLVLDTSGNVGIGTTNPSTRLDVRKLTAAGTYAYFGASGDGGARGLQFTSSDSGEYLGAIHKIDATSAYGVIDLATGGTARLRVDSTGNVGIGTTAPGTQLEIYKLLASNTALQPLLTLTSDYGSAAGTGFGSAIVFRGRTAGNLMQDAAKIAGYNENANDNGYALGFFTAPSNGVMSERMTILRGGNVGIGTAAPGSKLSIEGGLHVGGISDAGDNNLLVDGTIVQNGLKTTVFTGYTTGNSSFYVDVPVEDEGGSGAIFKVEATFAHYSSMSYNTLREFYISARGTAVEFTNIVEVNSGYGGSWTASKPNTTTLRITKVAGTYAGGGKYYIRVTTP